VSQLGGTIAKRARESILICSLFGPAVGIYATFLHNAVSFSWESSDGINANVTFKVSDALVGAVNRNASEVLENDE